MAYCNPGHRTEPHIVEKLTGQRFARLRAAKLVWSDRDEDGNLFSAYSSGCADAGFITTMAKILTRTCTSFSARRYLTNFRQRHGGVCEVLSRSAALWAGNKLRPLPTSIAWRSRRALGAAKDGMKAGYGLSNYWSVGRRIRLSRYDGGVEGGLTEMAYMADYNVGYFFEHQQRQRRRVWEGR